MASVVLPQSDLDWARRQVEAGAAPSIEAYLSAVLRRDRERAEQAAWLNAELAKGEASGVDPRSVDEIFDEIEAEFFAR